MPPSYPLGLAKKAMLRLTPPYIRRQAQPPGLRQRGRDLILIGPLLAIVVFLASACGGDGETDDGTAATQALERFVALGFGADVTTEVKQGVLPEDFPQEFPSYKGAQVKTTMRSSGEGGIFYLVALEAPDDRDTVLAFYEEQLNRGPWQVTGARADSKASTLQFLRRGEPPMGGTLMVEARREGGRGSDITLSLLTEEETASTEAGSKAAPRPEEGLALPRGFPAEFPLHPNAIILNTAWRRESDGISYVVRFITRDNEDSVITFYEDNLPLSGWTLEREFTDEDGFNLPFSDASTQQPAGIVVTRPSLEFDDYVEVILQFTAKR